jgi:radical SAM superfamily enzyme YgiQ (UPF0313 family)
MMQNCVFSKSSNRPCTPPYLLETPHNYQAIHSVNESGLFTCSGYDANPWTAKEMRLLVDLVGQENPDVIGISTRNFIDDEICNLLQYLKEKCASSLFVAGGFGPTFTPEIYLGQCDYVVRGEGESAILDIAEAVDAGDTNAIRRVPNISYVNAGRIVHNRMRPLLQDLDRYPMPRVAHDGGCFFVENDRVITDELAETYCLLIGRGCLKKCSYCCAGEWRDIYHKDGHKVRPYRPKSLSRALEEVRRAAENGFQYLFIADSFLMMAPEAQKTLFRELKNYNIRFAAQFHPTIALKHPDVIEVACECGLMVTVVGIQHGSEAFSRNIYDRSNNNETILEFARLLSRFSGLEIQYHLIIGNPLETDAHFEEQLDLIRRLRNDKRIRLSEMSFFCLTLFPNTTLQKTIAAHKLEQSKDDMVYKTGMSLLRLELEDEDFTKVYEDPYYREKPYFLINKLYETYLRKRPDFNEKRRDLC